MGNRHSGGVGGPANDGGRQQKRGVRGGGGGGTNNSQWWDGRGDAYPQQRSQPAAAAAGGNNSRYAEFSASLPHTLYVSVQEPGNAVCDGRFLKTSESMNGGVVYKQESNPNVWIFTNADGRYAIGDGSREYFRAQARHAPGTAPHDRSIPWIFTPDNKLWCSPAPLQISAAKLPPPQKAAAQQQQRQPQQQRQARAAAAAAAPAAAAARGRSHDAKAQQQQQQQQGGAVSTNNNAAASFAGLAKGAATVSLDAFRAALGGSSGAAVAEQLGVPQGSEREYFYAITNGEAAMTETRLAAYLRLRPWLPKIDVRRTGYVTAWDLEAALKSHRALQDLLGVQPHLAQSFMRQLDPDGAGRTKMVDFIKWCSATDVHRHEEGGGAAAVSRVVRRLESRGGGAVTAAEVRQVLQTDRQAQLELGWPAHQAPVIFKIINRGSAVPPQALATFFRLTSLFNRIDSGRDGFIDAWEFGHALTHDQQLQADLRVRLADAQSVFREIDASHSGSASFLEFYRYFARTLGGNAGGAAAAARSGSGPAAAAPVRYATPEDAYAVHHKLGEGSYGVVFLVSRKTDGLQVILKKPKMVPGFDMEDVRREAELMQRVKHPHIVRFVEAFKDRRGAVSIVTEYADGGDLRRKLRQFPHGLPQETAYLWAGQTLEALRYLHDRNIMHRDIKPDNIFLTKGGAIKLGDLGLAKQLRQTPRGAVTYTVFRGPAGQPSYMAPEQVRGLEHGPPIDIWSFGCVLYEMCTGRVCFSSPEAAGRAKGPPRNAPAHCYGVLERMLEPDPRARCDAAQALALLSGEDQSGCMSTYMRERKQRPNMEPGAANGAVAAAGLDGNGALLHPNAFFGR
eukprot:Rhum_TRINITY_DN14159_c17_g1::Rhum_TRINITY_DN14159_c17_g1_i1::g.71239::m.71239/K08857/NEK1_4_5; NIMA (never in mitosis gene a)-related kinase 1/4/5